MKSPPRGWASIRVGGLFRRRDERGRSDLPLLSVYRDLGVVPREGREDNFNRPGEDLDAYRVVRPGDLVLNKMKTWQGSLGVSAHEGIVSPAYFVAEQVGAADARFLHHLLRSRPLIAEYGARSKGIRPSQWDLPWDEFKDIRISLPPRAEQRAIADFLDRETARIDALITKKKSMGTRLVERSEGLVESKIRALASEYGEQRLKFAVSNISVGIVITPAAWYSPTGVLAIRGINVQPFGFDLSDVVYITTEGHALHSKSRLSEGDVVVVRTGQAGAAAVVPQELEGSNCIDLLIVRSGEVVPQYLAYVLNSDWTTKHVDRYSVGTIQSHFNVGALKDLPVPVPATHVQEQVVTELDQQLGEMHEIADRLERQVDLLHEHRQALITAAVTGQLDIPSAA